MTLIRKVRDKIKKICLAGLVLGSTSIASPQEPNTLNLEPRDFHLDFHDPITNFEANSNLKYSIDQLVGKSSDWMANEGGDKHIIPRLAQLPFIFYLGQVSRFTSHELGHLRAGKKAGKSNWDGEIHDFLFFQGNPDFGYTSDVDKKLEFFVGGLNQDEYNAYTITKNNPTRISFDEGINFLTTKFRDVFYNLSSREKYKQGRVRKDPEAYTFFLKKKGINLSQDELLLQSLTADILSLQTYDSIASLYNYIINGKRYTDRITLNLGNSQITPPIFSHYLTPKGSFFDISSTINPSGKNPIDLHIGTDADFIGDGNLNHLRFGGRYNDIPIIKGLSLSPFFSLNLDKSGNYEGILSGAEAKYKIFERLGIRAKVQYSENDLIENEVKGRDRGINFQLGLDFKW